MSIPCARCSAELDYEIPHVRISKYTPGIGWEDYEEFQVCKNCGEHVLEIIENCMEQEL
jgi:hypothetical protein